MGIHTALLVENTFLSKIAKDSDLGSELYRRICKGYGKDRFKNREWQILGEYSGDKTLAVLHHKGSVWAIGNNLPRLDDVPKFHVDYTLFDVSSDEVSLIEDTRFAGRIIAKATVGAQRKESQSFPYYVDSFGQALAVVDMFSSEDIGLIIFEGGTSWRVGKDQVPVWAKVALNSVSRDRRVDELLLALQKKVPVNLRATWVRNIIQSSF